MANGKTHLRIALTADVGFGLLGGLNLQFVVKYKDQGL